MERLLSDLSSSETDEKTSKRLLTKFAEKNQSTFQVIGSPQVKQDLVKFILDHIKVTPGPPPWGPDTQIQALIVLRILARGKEEGPLCGEDSLRQLAELADVSGNKMRADITTNDEANVIVEAVKCFCNIFLNHKELISKSTDLGILSCLARRFDLHCNHGNLSYEMVYFDLRLLFLITACDTRQRSLFLNEHKGIHTITNVISKTLNSTTQPDSAQATPTNEGLATPLSRPLTDEDMNVLCEAMKIIFNQTFDWQESEELLSVMSHLGSLIRLLLISLPCQLNEKSLQLISHVAEVLVNFPLSCTSSLLLPQDIKATPTLVELYPKLYTKKSPVNEGGVASGVGVVYTLDIDRSFEGWNLAPILALINMLHIRLSGNPGKHFIPTLMTALMSICKGNRIIRRFLKAEILPPLGQVVQRPDEGNSFKSKIIRLMTAASPYGAEEVAAEFLFVLCKENASRLVKYTGYGRAAGLLMARGLLTGGVSPGQANYSSDEDNSDTEEYLQSQDKLDPMTGGPSTASEGSPLDGMTEEEKEEEAKKLHDLIEKLNAKGIIRMAPLGSDNQPITFPPPSPPPQDNNDDNTHDE